ncbi:PhoX family protein [Piscinibacter sakaiensis]|uniref:PhoX family protein n=1 Tax=Piscinibacter sakaiensis TaxID=1547922 RepID=UPI003AAC8D59
MAKDFSSLEDSNRSPNPNIHQLTDPARRTWLSGGLSALLAGLLPTALSGCTTVPPATGSWPLAARPLLGFKPVPSSRVDRVIVPDGYRATVIAAWGDPVGIAGQMPAFDPDARNSAAEQALQFGMHHDGIHYISLDGSRRGLLVMNHEYVDDGLLHEDGLRSWSAEKVAKSQAAHGISVSEVAADAAGNWQLVRPSRFARRITATTPCRLGGPAGGHRLLRTEADPSGEIVLGTFNNCASGQTPWGTYLSGEENFNGYFDAGDTPDAHQRRWGLPKTGWYGWARFDQRFDAARHPNEPNRFGWIVEVDPMDPASTPVKRTALGRAAHEGAWVAVTRDGRAVIYSGEDAAFEYIYRFVSRDRIAPARPGISAAAANRELLDHGTLYVARFDADGSGRWLPLRHGEGPLTAANGFADQGEVLVKTRQASDLLGATKMDRPEWVAINQATRDVYCTLTSNSQRGAPGMPGADAANPRAANVMGQIIRWREDGDFDGETLRWSHLMLAGDPADPRPQAKGTVNGDAFANPDGLMLDQRGVLWIQTDMSAARIDGGDLQNIGNNQMLACDPRSGEVRRFLTGPNNCEITGATITPDGSTMFINVQHPGEAVRGRNDPDDPSRFSSWPSGRPGDRPRSATVVIRRDDGGVIGS